jgi:kinesin family protein 5
MGKNSIQVCCRFRPQNSLELKEKGEVCVDFNGETGVKVQEEWIDSGAGAEQFTFDRVFGTDSRQEDVYNETAKPLAQALLEGYNCTCFAYGQTVRG